MLLRAFKLGHNKMKEVTGRYSDGDISVIRFMATYKIIWFIIFVGACIAYVLTLGGNLAIIKSTTQEKQ